MELKQQLMQTLNLEEGTLQVFQQLLDKKLRHMQMVKLPRLESKEAWELKLQAVLL